MILKNNICKNIPDVDECFEKIIWSSNPIIRSINVYYSILTDDTTDTGINIYTKFTSYNERYYSFFSIKRI